MKTILILLVSFFIFSCGKDHTISGRVYNPVNDEGIANIQVQIFKDKFSMPGSQDGAGRKLIETVTTNANGEYAISFNDRDSKHYSLVFKYDTEKYYDNIKTGDIGVEDNTTIYDLPIVEFGYLKQEIHNISCFDENDVMKYRRNNLSVNENNSYSQNFFGCFDYVSDDFFAYPMGWIEYQIVSIKNGVQTTEIDSVYLGKNEYKTYEINY